MSSLKKEIRALALLDPSKLKGFMHLSGAYVLSNIFAVAVSALIARYVSREMYGQYQLIMSYSNIIVSFCLTGMTHSLLISSSKKHDGNLSRITAILGFTYIIGTCVLLGIAFYYKQARPELFIPMVLVACLFPFTNLQNIWSNWANGKGAFAWISFFQVAISVVHVLALGVCLSLWEMNLMKLTVIMVGSTALFHTIVYLFVYKKYRENNEKESSSIKYGFEFTLLSLPLGLVFFDKVLLDWYYTESAVAIYSVALIFFNVAKAIANIVVKLITPDVYSANTLEDAWQYIKPKIGKLLFFTFLVGVSGYFAMPIVINFIYTAKYADSIRLGQFFWILGVAILPLQILINILKAQKIRRFVLISSTVYPCLLFALYFLFHSFGAEGMIVSRAIALLFLAASAVFLFVYVIKINREKLSSE